MSGLRTDPPLCIVLAVAGKISADFGLAEAVAEWQAARRAVVAACRRRITLEERYQRRLYQATGGLSLSAWRRQLRASQWKNTSAGLRTLASAAAIPKVEEILAEHASAAQAADAELAAAKRRLRLALRRLNRYGQAASILRDTQTPRGDTYAAG